MRRVGRFESVALVWVNYGAKGGTRFSAQVSRETMMRLNADFSDIVLSDSSKGWALLQLKRDTLGT